MTWIRLYFAVLFAILRRTDWRSMSWDWFVWLGSAMLVHYLPTFWAWGTVVWMLVGFAVAFCGAGWVCYCTRDRFELEERLAAFHRMFR